MCIYFSYWLLQWSFLDVIDLQGLEIRSKFGWFSSQHLVDTVTFKCWWNISQLLVVYNTMCFRVFLKVSSILKTSSTGDQKYYGRYDTTTSQKINWLRILLNIFTIIPIRHVTQKKRILFVPEDRWLRPISDSDVQQLIQRSLWEAGGRTGISALLLHRRL